MISVAENSAFGRKIRRTDPAVIKARVAEVAGPLQIGHLLGHRPTQLPGGQRQRVAMGRAGIKRVHQTTSASITYVTHDQIETKTLVTRARCRPR